MGDDNNLIGINGGRKNLSEIDAIIKEALRREECALIKFKNDLDWENLKWNYQMKQSVELAFSIAFSRGFRAGEKEENKRLIELYKIDPFQFDVEVEILKREKKIRDL